MSQLLSLLLGAVAALSLAYAGFQAILPLHNWAFVRGVIGVVIILLSAGLPTWLVGRLHPRLSRAHLLAYFALLLTLFVAIALLSIQVEL